jgi:hypothetical protein
MQCKNDRIGKNRLNRLKIMTFPLVIDKLIVGEFFTVETSLNKMK